MSNKWLYVGLALCVVVYGLAIVLSKTTGNELFELIIGLLCKTVFLGLMLFTSIKSKRRKAQNTNEE